MASVQICIKLKIRQAHFTYNSPAKLKRKHEPPKPGQPEIKGRASPRAPIIAYDLGYTTAWKIICQLILILVKTSLAKVKADLAIPCTRFNCYTRAKVKCQNSF